MVKRVVHECPFYQRQSLVASFINRRSGYFERPVVIGKSIGGAAVDVSGKLIQQDYQGQTALVCVGPIGKFTTFCTLESLTE